MRTKTTITESELHCCQAVIESYRAIRAKESEHVDRLADLLGCDLHEAWDILQRYDTMESVLCRCATEIAPDEKPQLRLVTPPDSDSPGERAEWVAVVAIAACMVGVVIWCWAAWRFGE